MLYLFDTSALLAHHRRDAGWKRVQAIFEDEKASIFLASVSLTEFMRRLRELGASDAETLEIAEDYRALMDQVVSIDVAVAFEAVDVARATPKRLPLVDSLIAAAARADDACLVHRDEHMTHIPKTILNQLPLNKADDI